MTTSVQKVMGPALNPNPISVPQLLPNGANWVSFKRRIITIVTSKPLLLRHLEGRTSLPKPPDALGPKPTEDDQKEHQRLLVEYNDQVDEWRVHDGAVLQQIISNIPDSIFIRILNQDTAAEMWNALKEQFEGRTQAVKNELRNLLALTKCGDNEDVREHINRMQYKFEELSSMGVTIADSEYATILIRSMPKLYGSYFSVLSAVAEVSGNSLTPKFVMRYAIDEYDRRQMENAPKRGEAPTRGAVLYTFATDSGRSGQRGKRKGKGEEKRTCFICGEAGHVKCDCRKPKRDGDNAKESGNGSGSQSASSGTGN
jgi:hypothetical protein